MLPCGCNNGAEYMAKTTNNSFALLLLPCATRYRSMRDRMTIILVLAQPNVCKIWAIQVGCNMIPITDKSDNNKLILKHLEIKSVVLSEQTDMELTTSQVTWWHVWSLTVSCRSCSCPAAWWPPSWRCWPCGTSSPPTSSHPASSSQQICGGNFLSFNFRIFLCRHKMIAESSNPNYGEECLENWLKWRLYLSSSADQRLTVYPNTRVSLANLVRLLQETYKIR